MTILVTNPHNTELEQAIDLINLGIEKTRTNDLILSTDNPSFITTVYGCSEKVDEICHILRHSQALVTLTTHGTAVVTFFGKKAAIQQRHFVCNNDFLRENSVNYARTGKNKGSEHYNTYAKKQVVLDVH